MELVLFIIGLGLFCVEGVMQLMPPEYLSNELRVILCWIFTFFSLACWSIALYKYCSFKRKMHLGSHRSNDLIPISKAIDYIVNDSNAVIEKPHKPWFEDGARHVEDGVEHCDALKKIQDELSLKNLTAYGSIQNLDAGGMVFYDDRSRISNEYWEKVKLNPISALSETKKTQQTMVFDKSIPNYTNIHVSKKSIECIWPRKNILKRLIMVGRVRIKYP